MSQSFKLSAFEDCGVCCLLAKDFVKCVYCSEKACHDCYETYLLDQHEDKCMFCNKHWSYEFVQTNLRESFINGRYKDRKKMLMFEREKALLPATQIELAEDEKKEEVLKKQRVLMMRMKTVEKDMKHYMKIYKAKKSSAQEKEDAYVLMEEHLEKMRNIRNKIIKIREDAELNAEIPKEEKKTQMVVPCSMNDCRGFVVSEEKSFACGMCKTEHCKKCRCKKDDEHKCDPNTLETIKLLASDTKPCPKCHIPIFKIAGCDQIWCTGCHTAFSWKTGQIETGHIHNPHYWEYLQKQGRDVDGVRNMMGINARPNMNQCLTLEDTIMDYSNEYYRGLCVAIMHMRHGTVQERDDMNANKDLRKRYLLKEIDEKGLKMVLYKRERKRKFNAELVQILNMVYETTKDMILLSYTTKFVEYRSNAKGKGTNFSKDLVSNVCPEITNITNYSLEQIDKLCDRFNYVKPRYVIAGLEGVRGHSSFISRNGLK
jgi:hypothetical protein